MSDDVVRRLRQLGKQFHPMGEEELDACLDEEWHSVQTADETIEDAIAEIERLRNELVSMTDKFNRLKAARAEEER